MSETRERKMPTFEELSPFAVSEKDKKKRRLVFSCKMLANSSVAIVANEKGKDEIVLYSLTPAGETDGKSEAYLYDSMKSHIGHEIDCAYYGQADEAWNIALECLDCNEVIYDVNNPAAEELMGA